jgi:CRISPR/Cas system CMR subunit Cmr4 (Cas7 group RAMP superfamily)
MLGQEISESDEDNDKVGPIDDENTFIEYPIMIQKLKTIFKENIKKEKESQNKEDKENKKNEDNKYNLGDDSDDDLKFKNQEFSCQEKLQETKMVLTEDNLKLKDQSLKAKLNSLVSRINENVAKMQISINHQLFQTETSLIASVNNFTKKNDTNDFGMSVVPNCILKYKVVYEDIFSLLHSHP